MTNTPDKVGPIILGLLFYFVLPPLLFGVKNGGIFIGCVAALFLLSLTAVKILPKKTAPSTVDAAVKTQRKNLPEEPLKNLPSTVEEETPKNSEESAVKINEDPQVGRLGRFTVEEERIDADAIEEALNLLADVSRAPDPPRPSELTVEELIEEFDRIDALEDEATKDYELRNLPYVTEEVFNEANRRIADRPPPRVISLDTNRALGMVLSAFATEASDYVATADIYRRERKNSDDIAEMTPQTFAKRLGKWLEPTGIAPEPLKAYVRGETRRGYVRDKVEAYLNAPGDLVVQP